MAEIRGENTREQVRELLSKGLSVQEIAEKLEITEQAVYYHLRRMGLKPPARSQKKTVVAGGGKVVSLQERQKSRQSPLQLTQGQHGGRGRPIKHGRFSEKVLELLKGLDAEDWATITPDPDLDEQIRIAKAMILLWARKGKPDAVLVWQDHLRKLALAKAATGEPSERELIVDTAMPGVDRHASG